MARAVIQERVVSRPVFGRAGRMEIMAARSPMPMAQRMNWRVSRMMRERMILREMPI